VRLQVAVALVVGLVVGVLEEVELDLARDHRQEALRRSGLDLARSIVRGATSTSSPVSTSYRSHKIIAVLSTHGVIAHRRPVGPGQHVAVALVVAGEAVAGHRVVVHVAGDQVVAVLRAVLRHVLEEEPAGGALADEPALQVGKTISTVSISPLRMRPSSASRDTSTRDDMGRERSASSRSS
jgi:hypothetical protein